MYNGQLLDVLCGFFKREIPNLIETYEWNIPTIEGFHTSNKNNFKANIDLKNYLHNQWKAASEQEKKRLAEIIVSKWGGVRTNKPSTINRYVSELNKENPNTPLQGVASYSKIFSIARPDRYAIYDARVAACLNAIQLNANIRIGVAFNYVPGRNNIVGNATNNCGFTQTENFKVKTLIKKGWRKIEKNDTYKIYNEVLSFCQKKIPSASRYELEMALFANAECECGQQLTNLSPYS